MGSRREEDRNEKIIRGLMKLPPNRHCINCNSLGPQYVCTNFWTFVCVTCSGIHREFTHHVKSVSMSKFTSQEVDALQNGGNQRAKEIYFKGWDHQRQRFPDNSNADKVREFIKNVYEEKKYAEGIAHSKPPRDLQSLRSLDETRRASSYHSYSQSPPYDFQYEDQRYGKQGATLTRKPGSDRGIYVEKMSSFICSPTRISEAKFENEGSVSRFSDFSVSSGGDPVRSGTESPSFQKAYAPQRTMSSGSIGTISVKSCNSGHEPEYDAGFCQDNIVNISQSSAPLTNGTVDLSGASIVTSSEVHGSSSVDLFELPGAPSVDLFQAVPHGSASSTDICLPSQTSSPLSLDLFSGGVRNQSVSYMDKKSAEPSALSNEGWANFDSPLPAAPSQRPQALTSVPLPSGVGSSAKFDKVSSQTANSWLVLQNSGRQGSSLVSDPWKEGLQNFSAPVDPIDAQKWNAFDNSSNVQLPLQNIRPNSEPQSTADGPLLTANQHTISRVSEDSITDGFQRATSYEGFPGPTGNLDFVMGPKYVHSLMEQSNATSHRSTNPFDLPYECDLEPTHMFLDMSSLQAALPDTQVPTTFLGVTQPWFDQDPVTTYVPAAAQGGLAYMAGQAPTPQLANVQPQGPVVGGNPFA